MEPLVPKPHEFPLKNLGTSDSLESVVPWNHLIPSADETTESGYQDNLMGSVGLMKSCKVNEWLEKI